MKNIRTKYATDAARYEAIVKRDSAADGCFVYSVKTTGVYCRPSCAARRPRRENVQFHATCAAAERAGFRACKRCHPGGPDLEAQYAAKVAAACEAIKLLDKAPSLEILAANAGMSRFHFHRVFTRVTGVTPKAYAKAQRSERMRGELAKSDHVTDAIYAAGYNSNGRFYAESARMLGMNPRTFQKRGQGEAIRFAVGECSLGSVLVASTEKGVCAILMGDDPNALAEDLQNRFSKAHLIAGDRDYERTVASVVGFIDTPTQVLNLPLDIRGTAFQQRVWKALAAIPAGKTESYTEVARRMGATKSVRAVAGACAANALAVAIPCHRVVRSDGSLSGYRWGIDRKRALLLKESAH